MATGYKKPMSNEKELQKQLDGYWENTAKERERTHTKKMYKKYLEGVKID